MARFERSPLEAEEWDGTLVEGFLRRAGVDDAQLVALVTSESFDELETAVDDFLRDGLGAEVVFVEPLVADTDSHLRVGRVHVGLSRLIWPMAQSLIALAATFLLRSPATGAMGAVNLLKAIGDATRWLSADEVVLVTWASDCQRRGESSRPEDAPADPTRLLQHGVLAVDDHGDLRAVF